jgi:NAD(P)-dependent dehydrogenase (short-subunit alcohol dehydrogenase family)
MNKVRMIKVRMNKSLFLAGAAASTALVAARAFRASRALDFRDRSVLITGGSRGLGLLIARELAQEGARIMLIARDERELEAARQDLAASGATVTTAVHDVGIRGEAERAVEEVVDRTGRLDVLINNAGIIQVGPIDHMDPHDFEQAMAVHLWGPLHAMRAAIPIMRAHGGGRIVNISSIGGKIGVPHLAPYCASKFALTGLSESLRPELARERIYVTTVCPGLMRTGSPFNAWFKGRHRDEFTWFAIVGSLPLASINGRRAAVQVLNACRYGDAELVVGLPARLAVVANAVMPGIVAAAMDAADRVLPGPTDRSGDRARSGWQSSSAWAPSILTRLNEQAARENNEIPPVNAPGAPGTHAASSRP